MAAEKESPRVVIVGAGFAGLWAARTLADSGADVLVVDRHNYHTFLALLYQVAAAELEPEEIAYPVRSALAGFKNTDFLLADASRVDFARRVLETDRGDLSFDYLILGTGSVTDTFGVSGAEENAFFLKTLGQGVELRNRVIWCFEEAAREIDPVRRRALLTFLIVGGGATGVEFAGALSELVQGPLRSDHHRLNFDEVRIVLVEAADRVVASMPEAAQAYTLQRLRRMGVEVRLRTVVDEVLPASVRLDGGEEVPSHTIVWTAGVQGEPLAQRSGLPVGRDGRVAVDATLRVPGHDRVYAVGDLAVIAGCPMVAQTAIQSGVVAAENIRRQMAGLEPKAFKYRELGSMITIGRGAAVVALGGRVYRGFPAWVLWLVVHIYNLIGFRNRIMVLINWAWDYLLYDRAVRVVFPSEGEQRGRCGRRQQE